MNQIQLTMTPTKEDALRNIKVQKRVSHAMIILNIIIGISLYVESKYLSPDFGYYMFLPAIAIVLYVVRLKRLDELKSEIENY